MVPPRSDRVSRAPPYSRTRKLPYPYRAVTVCGAPFQTLPVRVSWPLAWSAFARRYLRSRCCCPFLRLLRCFSSPGSPPMRLWIHRMTTAISGGLPHSEIRGSTGARPSPRLFAACHVLHRLSVPRHSPDALIVPRPRPTPSTRARGSSSPQGGSPKSAVQRSDLRAQSLRQESRNASPIRLRRLISALRPLANTAAAARANDIHACRCSRIGSTYPCPGPTSPHHEVDEE